MSLLEDYNGTDTVQTNWYIVMNCANYISRFLKTYDRDVASNKEDIAPTVRRTKMDLGWDRQIY